MQSPSPTHAAAPAATGSYRLPLIILTSLFFMWGFITALNDILIPHLKSVFDLNYTQAILVQFCFFGAYFLVSLPAGALVGRIGYQKGLVLGLLTAAVGCLLFLPAASLRLYPLFLGALFVLASGVTLLQVSANPYVTALGPASSASGRLTLTQAFNSLGTTVAPLIGAALIFSAVPELPDATAGALSAADKLAEADSVKLPYLILAAMLGTLALLFAVMKLPALHTPDDHQQASFSAVLRYRHLVLGALAIFTYVGAEVSIGSFMISFIKELGLQDITEHEAARYVAWYWGGAMVGRFVGVWLMMRVDARYLLAANASCAVLLVLFACFYKGNAAAISLLAVGLCNSIMFPTIFSLALKDLGALTSRGSGLLCCAIVGGALIPLLQGMIADWQGLQISFLLAAACYVYIAYYGLEGSKVRSPPVQ
ncbi:sugar MFS transporter [Pseudomaricurvus sp. HS19]|uniref:sugar MFS transporter n=1 Tax=Pseudomaricurvus sp. HS19 TaxID=2692626 RepID=UPI0013680992|nr:sugar MFS transporter [Pseudomaricurvus sp. HS19]MYM62807.1 glucose/galactose MFS transporter [Pseudomaricurvus sp. HS19]